jgi:hypothetical protein
VGGASEVSEMADSVIGFLLFILLAMACLMGVAGWNYLSEGNQYRQDRMNLILWLEMRLGHWDKK